MKPLACLFLACVALCGESSAQCELQTLVLPELPPSNGTGWKIAQDGETFAVAGPGSVHVYRQDGLTAFRVQELPLPDSLPDSSIYALALDGDTLAVSTLANVLVYERRAGTWVEVISLLPAPNEFHFGLALALDGERLLVTAREFRRQLPNEGVVYVFERVAGVWTRVGRLTKPGVRKDSFGEALDLEGERLVVGVSLGSGDPLQAYVFERTAAGWQRHDVVSARPAPHGSGQDLDLRGDVLMVCGSSETAGGMARVFEHDGAGWRETGELVSPDSIDAGGTSVAIVDQDLALVGEPGNSERRRFGGAVHVFERIAGAWQETGKLFPSSPAFWQGFGMEMTSAGDLAILGSVYGPVRTFSPRESGCRTLIAFPAEVSLTQGGKQTLWLNPAREHAGQLYCLLGSATGFDPGFRFRGARVPLVPDRYFVSSTRGRPPFVNNIGVLAARKPRAAVTIDVPPLTDIALAGLTLYHAFLVLDQGVVRHVSNVRTLTLVP